MASEQQNESRRYGRALAQYLASGGEPQPVASTVPLIPGEQCFGIAHAELFEFNDPFTAGRSTDVSSGRLHVTSVRMLFDGKAGRVEVPLSAIRVTASDGVRLRLDLADQRRLSIVLPYPDYWHVLLARLTAGTVVEPLQG